MVWDCHFNLLEPILMHKIVPWSFFVLITLPRNKEQAYVFGLVRMRARSDWSEFCLSSCPEISPSLRNRQRAHIFGLVRACSDWAEHFLGCLTLPIFLSICPEMHPLIR
jgi:hypothetical protein